MYHSHDIVLTPEEERANTKLIALRDEFRDPFFNLTIHGFYE